MYASMRAPGGRASARGSSLVAVVVLFSLVGMVSAFAIPRYTRIANQVRTTQVMALSGTLRGVAQSAHQQYLASGSKATAATVAGKPVSLRNGYPDLSTAGIGVVMVDRAGFTTKATQDSVIFMKRGAVDAEQCAVTYSVPKPQVTADTLTSWAIAGC